MKFDCAKVSGKVDYVRSVNPISGGYKANISIDGSVIPQLRMTGRMYEELEEGESITLYGIFRNSKKKIKNDGVIYGIGKASGEKMFDTQFRYQVPLYLSFYAALAFVIVFILGFFPSIFLSAALFHNASVAEAMSNTAMLATIEGCIAGAFFLWRAWVMVKSTSNPETWEVMSPATLSSRFSKFHK